MTILAIRRCKLDTDKLFWFAVDATVDFPRVSQAYPLLGVGLGGMVQVVAIHRDHADCALVLTMASRQS